MIKWIVIAIQVGLNSVYIPGDGFSGKFRADGKPFTTETCHMAHRTWKLGSYVRVCAGPSYKKCTITRVRDRGPYGACDSKGLDRWNRCVGKWSVKIKKSDPGKWRAIADLSKCVARKIGIRGIKPIRLELLKKVKR